MLGVLSWFINMRVVSECLMQAVIPRLLERAKYERLANSAG